MKTVWVAFQSSNKLANKILVWIFVRFVHNRFAGPTNLSSPTWSICAFVILTKWTPNKVLFKRSTRFWSVGGTNFKLNPTESAPADYRRSNLCVVLYLLWTCWSFMTNQLNGFLPDWKAQQWRTWRTSTISLNRRLLINRFNASIQPEPAAPCSSMPLCSSNRRNCMVPRYPPSEWSGNRFSLSRFTTKTSSLWLNWEPVDVLFRNRRSTF